MLVVKVCFNAPTFSEISRYELVKDYLYPYSVNHSFVTSCKVSKIRLPKCEQELPYFNIYVSGSNLGLTRFLADLQDTLCCRFRDIRLVSAMFEFYKSCFF